VTETEGKHVVEKKSAINLLVAFVFATKHYLREEYSHDFEDIKPLLNHLRKFSTPSSNLSMKNQKKKKAECRYTAHDYVTPSNIPLELHYYISSYVNSVNSRSLAEPFLVSSMEIGKSVVELSPSKSIPILK
jgi:putative membrane protein